jgi:hypothetical protein
MKLALFYMSKDMYSHDCEYTRTAKINQPEQDLFDYFVSEWGSGRAAIRMYIVDEETLTMTLAKELLRPLKTKIVINAKKVPAPKEEFKAFKWDDISTTSVVQAQITAMQQEMTHIPLPQWPTLP